LKQDDERNEQDEREAVMNDERDTGRRLSDAEFKAAVIQGRGKPPYTITARRAAEIQQESYEEAVEAFKAWGANRYPKTPEDCDGVGADGHEAEPWSFDTGRRGKRGKKIYSRGWTCQRCGKELRSGPSMFGGDRRLPTASE
jgi:hypothetical protein